MTSKETPSSPEKVSASDALESLAHQRRRIFFLLVASIASSVSLILANKWLMTAFQFRAVTLLSALHFVTTALLMRVLAWRHVFVPARSHIPNGIAWRMAVLGALSIVMMNASLQCNSVGFYQMTKLLCIPCMVYLQQSYKWSLSAATSNDPAVAAAWRAPPLPSGRVIVALIAILLGVGMVTVTDVSASLRGLVFGFVAVTTTAQFQLWQSAIQQTYRVNAIQATDALMPFQAVVALIAALLIDGAGVDLSGGLGASSNAAPVKVATVVLPILLTCLLAVVVNVVTFSLLGATSAVTYQVTGHLKTLLTLVSGYIFYPETVPEGVSLWTHLFGLVVASFGMVAYSDVKQRESTAAAVNTVPVGKDVIAQCVPASVLARIDALGPATALTSQVSAPLLPVTRDNQ